VSSQHSVLLAAINVEIQEKYSRRIMLTDGSQKYYLSLQQSVTEAAADLQGSTFVFSSFS